MAGQTLIPLGAGDQIGVSLAIGPHAYRFGLAAGGFWQVHREAPALLAGQVLAASAQACGPGGAIWDLYCGAGLFSLPLAHLVGPGGQLWPVEGDARSAGWAVRNLAACPQARVTHADVAQALSEKPPSGARPPGRTPGVVVIDPPRVGAGLATVRRLAAIGPRRVIYVACDPAAMARDIGALAAGGYALTSLRAFDLYPHTHHVECIAVLDRA